MENKEEKVFFYNYTKEREKRAIKEGLAVLNELGIEVL